MIILRAYKTELDPTYKQVEQLIQHAGCARWAYNWGLRKKIEAYKATGKSPSAVDLHRELNSLKGKPTEEGGVPWMYESSKCAPQEALRNLDAAYKSFFRRCKTGAKCKGFPRFKSRKNGIGSFRLTGSVRASEAFELTPEHVRQIVVELPDMYEQSRMSADLREEETRCDLAVGKASLSLAEARQRFHR